MFKETGKKRCVMMPGVIFLNTRISEQTIFVLRENYRVFHVSEKALQLH